jgi:hypothetical protein
MLRVMAREGQQLGLQVGGKGLHRQPVSAGAGDRQRPPLGLADRGPLVIDLGGGHTVGVAEDIGGAGQLPGRQPPHADATVVWPLGQAPGPPCAQCGKQVIEHTRSQVTVAGEDLLHTHQVRPSTGDQFRDLLQLARILVLGGLGRVSCWPLEVLQVPCQDSEHDPLPRPSGRWWLLQELHHPKPI